MLRCASEPGSLVLDTVEGERWGPRSARSRARGAIHRTLPGVAFNHEAEPVADPAEFDAWAADDFAALRERYTRRTENFRTKLTEAVEASAGGGVGAVFLLQHYEHPRELCEVIERRWPSLRFVLLTINLVGEYEQACRPGEFGPEEYEEIIMEMDVSAARQVCAEEGLYVPAGASLEACQEALRGHCKNRIVVSQLSSARVHVQA